MLENMFIVLALVWLLQMALAYRQARLFYRHVNNLKKLGRCATGLSGGYYRRRTYVALVAHPMTRIVIKAEQLRGITVFARLRPLPQLEGRLLDELLSPTSPMIGNVPPCVIEAARSAAEAIQASLEKDAIPVAAS